MARWPACCAAGGSRRSWCRDRGSTGRDGQRDEPAERGRELARPGPGALDAEPAPALSAGEPRCDVQQPIAQRLGLRSGEVAVQEQVLGPGEEIDRPPAPSARTRWCADAQIPELTTLAETIETWWPAIEVFLTTGLTNARTEGTNRLIKQVKRAACGFRNRENYRRRVRLHCTRQTRRLSPRKPTVPAQSCSENRSRRLGPRVGRCPGCSAAGPRASNGSIARSRRGGGPPPPRRDAEHEPCSIRRPGRASGALRAAAIRPPSDPSCRADRCARERCRRAPGRRPSMQLPRRLGGRTAAGSRPVRRR